MKKISLLLCVCSLALLAGCGNKNASSVVIPNAAAQTQTYTGTAFTLKFPAVWKAQENVYGATAMFFTPQATGDQYRENVGIVTETLPNTMTIDEYLMLVQPQLKNMVKDYKEISSENVVVGGLTGKKLIYEGSQVNYKLKWQQVFVIKGTTVYIINYTAIADTFEQYIVEVNAMIKSFLLK